MPVTPGVPGANLPPGDDAIIRRIQELERAVRELSAANPLATAGLVPSPNLLTVQGGLTVAGTETVSGNLNVTGTETVGGNLNVTGSETVSGTLNVTGPMTVGGTLSLPNGIINNAALASPVVFGSVGASQTNFSVPSAGGAYAFTNITVPAGYSQATVHLTVDASIYNTSGVGDYVYVSANINGVTGGEAACWVPNGYQISIAASGIRTMTGLGGGAFPVSVHVRTGSATMPTQAANIANLNAVALFLR